MKNKKEIKKSIGTDAFKNSEVKNLGKVLGGDASGVTPDPTTPDAKINGSKSNIRKGT